MTAKIPSIESVRSYWDARPCNIRHSRSELGSKEYFDEVEARKYFVEPRILAFAEFNRWQGKKALDVGCGICTDAVNFVMAGTEYTALELSEEYFVSLSRCFEISFPDVFKRD